MTHGRHLAATRRATAGLLIAACSVACSGGGSTGVKDDFKRDTTTTPPPQCVVNSLNIRPNVFSVTVGDSVVLTLSSNVSNCAASTPVWSTEDATVATVRTTSDPLTSVARGVRAGRTGIRVLWYGWSFATDLTVTGPTQPVVATVTVSPATAALTVGQKTTLGAVARDAAGAALSGRTVAWSSDNTAVATVAATGEVTAVGAGTATIAATVDNVRGTANVTVAAVQPAGVRVSPTFRLLAVGGTGALTATDNVGAPLAASALTVSSRSPGVATASGLTVTGVAAGVTDVVVANGAASDSARVAVTPSTGLALLVAKAVDQSRTTAAPGSTLTLDVIVARPAGATGDVGSLAGTIRWDATQLQLQSSAGVETGWAWTPNAASGSLTFAAFSTAGTNGTFTLARLTFTVLGSASASPRVVAPSVTSAGSAAGQSLTAQAVAVPTAVIVQ